MSVLRDNVAVSRLWGRGAASAFVAAFVPVLLVALSLTCVWPTLSIADDADAGSRAEAGANADADAQPSGDADGGSADASGVSADASVADGADAASSAHSAGAQGTLPLLMIVVGFDGGDEAEAVPYSSAYDWGSYLFEGAGSLPSYYSAMSEGSFTVAPAAESSAFGADNANAADADGDGIVHLTLHEAYRPWGLVNVDEDVMQDFGAMVLEAFHAAADYVDYARYDVNGDGVLTTDELAVVICVPGYDASAFADADRSDVPAMWPHSGRLAYGGQVITSAPTGDEQEPTGQGSGSSSDEAYALDSYIAITENLWYEEGDLSQAQQEPLGVLCHELGHYLGLPDLYPLNADADRATWGAYRVRSLSLMGAGGWAYVPDADGMPAYSPTALDAWSRYVLGWELPAVAAISGDYVVSSQYSEAGYRSLLVPTRDPDVCFLLENRELEGIDAALAADYGEASSAGGIVAWRIDKAACRDFGEGNHVNDTDHAPGVMPAFFERRADGSYTLQTGEGTPVLDEPFLSADSFGALLGNPGASVPLALDGLASENAQSGVSITVSSTPGRDMAVHVDLDEEAFATCEVAHALLPTAERVEVAAGEGADDARGEGADGDADARVVDGENAGVDEAAEEAVVSDEADVDGSGNADGNASAVPASMADIICAALMRETGCEAAVVGSSAIARSLDAGPVSYADAYALVPSDEVIRCYDVGGAQLAELLESCLGEADEAVGAAAGGEPVVFGGIDCTVDLRKPSGSRVCDVAVGGDALDERETYRVAVPERLAVRLGLVESAARHLFALNGTPADALRSFMQLDAWEQEAVEYAGSVRYLEAPAQPQSLPAVGNFGDLLVVWAANLPSDVWWVWVAAAACVALGALVSVLSRR